MPIACSFYFIVLTLFLRAFEIDRQKSDFFVYPSLMGVCIGSRMMRCYRLLLRFACMIAPRIKPLTHDVYDLHIKIESALRETIQNTFSHACLMGLPYQDFMFY